MSILRFLPAAAAAMSLAATLAHSQTTGNRLRAGAAKVDITPQASELALSTDSIRDRLFARAIVVDDGASCAVLVGLDQSGVDDDGLQAAIAKASAAVSCPAANFIVSSTHTHSSNTKGLGVAAAAFVRVADAIVSATKEAKAHLAPARIGYATTQVDLNVNRDQYSAKLGWRQAPNPDGSSDKTLAVVAFIGEDEVPIGVYMNYAMHPINFYLTGVISADFPGEACGYLERYFDGHTVAVFSQGASGDQNPAFLQRGLNRIRSGRGPLNETVGAPPPQNNSPQGFNPAAAASSRQAVAPENLEAYKQAILRTGEVVTMEGTLIGASAVRLMRDKMQYASSARIWGGQEKFTCPGQERLDAANPARENVFPGYKEGPDVNLRVGVLRIGDIHFATVNGEVYSGIAMRLKAASPANKTIVVTLANGRANSGYIYSDDAYSHLSFQVIGSRLQPGCAEGRIIGTALDLMHRSGD